MWKGYQINEIIKISELYSLFTPYYRQEFIFRGEMHNFWECVVVLDGAICASADERVYNLRKNDVIFHKPLELHKFHIDNPNGAKLLIFSFSMTGDGEEFFKNKVFSLNPTQQKIVDAFLEFLNSIDKGNAVDYIEHFQKNNCYPQMAVSYIYQLCLSYMCENQAVTPSENDDDDAKLFSLAVGFMTGNISNNLSVADIATAHNISETGLKHIFKKFAGMGVHQYFISLKINTAIQMLGQGKTVSDTAEKLGFSSQGYFSFVFKRETGVSPSKYQLHL